MFFDLHGQAPFMLKSSWLELSQFHPMVTIAPVGLSAPTWMTQKPELVPRVMIHVPDAQFG
jgi:hypothetical protein